MNWRGTVSRVGDRRLEQDDSVGSTSTLFYPGRRSPLSHTFAARFPIPEFAGVSSFRSCWRRVESLLCRFQGLFSPVSLNMRLPAPDLRRSRLGQVDRIVLVKKVGDHVTRKLPLSREQIKADDLRLFRGPLFATASPRIPSGGRRQVCKRSLESIRPRRRTAFARRGSLRAWSGELGFTSHSD